MTGKFIAYLLAVVVTYVLGVVLVSQFNVSEVVGLGFSVSFDQRWSAVLHDLIGMLSTYLPLISVALLIAFVFTSLVLQRFIGSSITSCVLLFVLAGFVAIVAMHLIMTNVLGIAGVAPTRSLVGLLAQGVAGAVGGYTFIMLSKRKW